MGAGALGWLQPRFHLRGPAMLLAEELEETALRDTVNVTSCFLHALQRNLSSGDDSGEGEERSRAEEEVPAGWEVAQTLTHHLSERDRGVSACAAVPPCCSC